jgi:hypothetical protein
MEFLLGVAALDPCIQHTPPFLRVRLFYIFRLYDVNGGELSRMPPRVDACV